MLRDSALRGITAALANSDMGSAPPIVAVVPDPEFHMVKNCVQLQVGKLAVISVPISLPLMENCNWAGLGGQSACIQVEKA